MCRFSGSHNLTPTGNSVFKKSINHLDNEVRTKLRKGSYDFSPADSVLSVLGVENSRVQSIAPDKDSSSSSSIELPLRAAEKKQIDFKGKLYLAPLTTVGNLPFRRTCLDFGVDVTCGEMALATNLLQGQQTEWALVKRHPSESLFGVQLCGGYADALCRTAQLIEDTCQVDFIDVNLGCPIDSICGRSAGASLLLKPQKIKQISTAMCSVMDTPLTLKMRKGYWENTDLVHKFLPEVSSWGVSAVTLHGRSRSQRYCRLSDWDYIYSCAGETKGLQLIGNGDIFSFTDWETHMEASSDTLATCMIGRGALIKPWIFTEIHERRHWDISATERLEMLKTFTSRGLEHWGSDEIGVEKTRRFLLEWLSFLYRYVPVGILEVLPQRIHSRPPAAFGRTDLETLFLSDCSRDWVKISEMLLGTSPEGFSFVPKHRSNAYTPETGDAPS
eukprot:g191.t1